MPNPLRGNWLLLNITFAPRAGGLTPNLIPLILGFVVCLLLWLNLGRPAQKWGAVWMLAGIAFGAWKTQCFRGKLNDFDLPAEEG